MLNSIYNKKSCNTATKYQYDFLKVKRGLKEAKRPNFFSWPTRKKRSQNRVIWFERGQVNNPDIMGSRSYEIIHTPNLKDQTNYLTLTLVPKI